jgi:chemotaxis protein methyltransferase CheR
MPAQGNYIKRNNLLQISALELDTFLVFMESEYQFKLKWYNSASAERRLRKTIKNLQLNSLTQLQASLQNGTISFQRFLSEFTVNVTQVFREPESLKDLKNNVLPFFRKELDIKVLLVGSSSGAELATLCIILKENGLLERSKIVATDISENILREAYKPRLQKSDLIDGHENYLIAGGYRELDHYFLGAGAQAYLDESLLKKVEFKTFDICHSELEDRFDLVICKNLLIYFQYDEQHHLINNLSRHMKDKAFLALGEKESILRLQKLNDVFSLVSRNFNIYRKN